MDQIGAEDIALLLGHGVFDDIPENYFANTWTSDCSPGGGGSDQGAVEQTIVEGTFTEDMLNDIHEADYAHATLEALAPGAAPEPDLLRAVSYVEDVRAAEASQNLAQDAENQTTSVTNSPSHPNASSDHTKVANKKPIHRSGSSDPDQMLPQRPGSSSAALGAP